MFKIFLRSLGLFVISIFLSLDVYAIPDSTMSITPTASDGAIIEASDENARNNIVSSTYNAHGHTDISQVANTLKLGDGTAGNKTIQANNADGTKPFLKYDDTNDVWTLSVNGVDTSAMVKKHGTVTTHNMLPQSPARGDIMYSNGSDWVVLSAGTSGYYLKTQGAAADPVWGNVTGDFTLTSGMISATRDLTATSADVSYTGLGFQPTKVVGLAVLSGASYASWGFQKAIGANGAGLSTSDTNIDNYTYNNGSLFFIASGAGAYQGAYVKTYDADGVTLTWTKTGSASGTAYVYIFCDK